MPFLMITIVVRYGQPPYYRTGVAALPRFAPYVASDYCADVLRHINHPFALTLLIRVAGHTKRCHDRMTKACAAFPHAALAALAELLVQKKRIVGALC